jgi:peptide/nickel transport system substrate-binding protein
MLQAISSVTSSAPLSVSITLKEAYVPFLAGLASFEAFPVVPRDSVPPGGEKLSLHPPGTGPFMMVEYRPNQLVAFKRFDQYWQKGIPYLEGVHFRPVEDDTVRLTAIRSGDLDVTERVPYDQVLRIQKGELKGLDLVTAEGSGYVAPAFNTENPPFNNVKVRKAVLYALDKEKILEGVTWGFGIVTDQKMARHSRWFVPLPQKKRDLEKARTLLKEAGYTDGLKVKGQVSNAKRDQGIMQIIQSQLREANIHLELEVRDFTRHLNDLRDGNFTFSMSASTINADPDLAYYDRLHTDREVKKLSNYTRYSSAKMDTLLEQGRKEADFRKRYQIYKEIVEILQEEVPDIPLGFTPYVFAFRANVKNFQVQPTGPFYYGLGGLGMTWMER